MQSPTSRTARLSPTLAATLTLALGLSAAGCGDDEPADRAGDQPVAAVHHLRISFSEAYVLEAKDGRLIMIDTGVPGSEADLEAQLQSVGKTPEDLALVVVTHGHGDHAGNARYLQARYHVPVLAGLGDLDKLTRGMTDLAKSQSIGEWGEKFRPVSDLAYAPVTPDITIGNDQELSLAPYGIQGTIRGLAGHTPGELVVRAGAHLFVGDALGGGFEQKDNAMPIPTLAPTGAAIEWVFAEDPAQARSRYADLDAMLDGVETVYPAHFGPLTAAAARQLFDAHAP